MFHEREAFLMKNNSNEQKSKKKRENSIETWALNNDC